MSDNGMRSEQNHAPGRGTAWGRRRTAAFLGALALLGMVSGYLISRSMGHRVHKGVVMAGLQLAGLDAAEARARLEARCESLGRAPVILVLGSRSFTVTPVAAGLGIDYEASVQRALSVGRTGDILARLRTRRAAAENGLVLEPIPTLRTVRWEEFCRGLEAEVNEEPVEAHIEVDRNGHIEVKPSRDGRALDRAALADLLWKHFYQERNRRSEMCVTAVHPKLSNRNIAEWPLDQVLGIYTSKFNAADDQRSNNLKMAAQALDGIIVAPGEEFSFNKHVGPRVPEKGYLEAPVISRNRMVLGVGGGVCQTSGTLFNAALLANLPITKRSTHSIPSTYVPLGRDATVVYDAVDLAFVNNTSRPVVITSQVKGSYLTMALVGHWDEEQQVDLTVEIKEKIPYETVTENDPGLAAGTRAVTQRGRIGYKVQLWRMVARPGKPKAREPIGGIVLYPPNKEIVKRGIGSPRFGSMTPPAKPPMEEAQPPAAEGDAAPAPPAPVSATDGGSL